MLKHFQQTEGSKQEAIQMWAQGGKQKQTHTVDVGGDYNPQCDEVYAITIDIHPHHSTQLGWKAGDDHARPSTLSP